MNAPHPKLRTRKCRICKQSFHPWNSMQKVCGPVCAKTYAEVERVKKEKKADRAKKKVFKTIPELIAETQTVCNAYIRARDYGKPCICCGESMDWITPNKVDAGHYRTRGAAGHLRFDERNIHAQKKRCNHYKAGNQAQMREGLIKRIGLTEVMALENDNRTHKWTREELEEIKTHYRAKLKELKKHKESGFDPSREMAYTVLNEGIYREDY